MIRYKSMHVLKREREKAQLVTAKFSYQESKQNIITLYLQYRESGPQ